MRLFAWPEALPSALQSLQRTVAETAGRELIELGELADLAAVRGRHRQHDALLVAPDCAVATGVAEATTIIDSLEGLSAAAAGLNIVAVVGDGFLGTDRPRFGELAIAATVVAAVRSLAVVRGSTTRANVVAVPAGLIGEAGSQQGPLVQRIGLAEVVDVVAFFLEPSNTYLNGQVLFVNGGRHLFSSFTA